MLTLTTDQMRRVELMADQSGLSYAQLMENAGDVAYRYLEQRYALKGKRCLILAGAGNNGGDGFVIARRMQEAGGTPVVALCCGLPKSKLAARNLTRLLETGCLVVNRAEQPERVKEYIYGAQIIVDALFGTGFHGSLDGPLAELAEQVNAVEATRISLDVPSGMNADTGRCSGACFQADITLSFGAYKPAHQEVAARPICGHVEVLDIGISEEMVLAAVRNVTDISAELVCSLLPVRLPDSHKGNFGRLLNIAGSLRMGGAAMMCTLAALRSGVGLTTLAAPAGVAARVAPFLMEAMTVPLAEAADGALSTACEGTLARALEQATACLIGCGLSVTPDVSHVVEFVLKQAECTLVLDADALNCVAAKPNLLGKVRKIPVLTPHLGEMARLLELTPAQIAENAVSVAQLFARERNAVVVLKGHHTLIASPSGEVFRNTTGNAALAKGGSGDVLAGMIAAFCAQGLSGKNAAVCAVYLHGLCADRLTQRMSDYSVLARDVIDEIPFALKTVGR